jgi:protein-disulfide isomerase
VSKIANPREFVQAVRAYDATPEWLSKAIGYGLPVLELCLGVVLVLGVTVRIAAAVSAVLLVVFAIGILQAAARGISLVCGCFGGGGTTDGSTTYTLDILRDLGLLIAAVFLVLWPMTRLSIEEYLARHDHVEMPSAKRMRTPEGRRRYETQVAAARERAHSRALYLDSSIIIVVLLVSVIGIGVQAGRAKVSNVVPGTNATAADGIVFGKKAAATVDVYEDFGCPNCKQFEADARAQLEKDVRANLAQVRYHPIAILDRGSPNRYSTRAANAAICVSDVSVDAFVAYHDLLYGSSGGASVQPTEGTAGPGNAKLTSLAKQAGVPAAKTTTVSDCILNETYTPLVQQLTEKASEAGVSGTPTIFVNGRKLADHKAATLFSAITAANQGHTPSPSQTPSPTPTVTPSATGSASPSPTK